MIISLFLRHFKIYKGINYVSLSEGNYFSSIIGENGVGKSTILEALDCCFNKKTFQDWAINNEAKSEGISGENFPYIAPVFLIRKEKLRQTTKLDIEFYEKVEKLSKFLWTTKHQVKGKFLDEFYYHRDELKKICDINEYFLIVVGKKYNDYGIYFGSYQKSLDFITETPHIKYEEAELQKYFKGFYEYIISHYSFLYIPVDTDVHTYTKLETQAMQKLMDKNIQLEIEKAIKPDTVKQINKELDKFVKDIEISLETYEYKGRSKNSLTMPDLVSKIIEAYFSIKVLNKKIDSIVKSIPVSELSSGEKRKALIDIAYSFLMKNNDRDNNIILAIDEPEASLHISSCFEQFEKLIKISKQKHQIIISTHWYGYLPIVSNGSVTSIKKSVKNEISSKYFNLSNYREYITHARKKEKGALLVDYNIKSYNDLVQSIVFSMLQNKPYYWIICEGMSEKIYFEFYFDNEILNKNLRLLPVGGFTEVRKIYNYLLIPIKDPDYIKNGKVFCLIDTDDSRIEVPSYEKNKNLFFDRLLFKENESILVEVNDNHFTPPTEIEDCLNPIVFFHTLQEFQEEYISLKAILFENIPLMTARYSSEFLDLRKTEKVAIKVFFDGNEGYNKIRFAKKYIELIQNAFFDNYQDIDWINEIKKKLYN